MDIHIYLSKKRFFALLAGILVLAIALGVYAYGTSNPPVFGHSAAEVDLILSNGTHVSLQNAYNGNLLGGATGGSNVLGGCGEGIAWGVASGCGCGGSGSCSQGNWTAIGQGSVCSTICCASAASGHGCYQSTTCNNAYFGEHWVYYYYPAGQCIKQ